MVEAIRVRAQDIEESGIPDVQPQRVVAVTKFAANVPLADDVFRLYEQGVLRGWSVGLLPRRA